MSSDKKLLFIMDRNKQVVASGGHFVIDYVGDVTSITRDAYFLNNGKVEKQQLTFDVREHLKTKSHILKINKHRRDARSKGQCSFFSLVSLREVENGN